MRKIPRFFGGVGLKTASKALALALLCGPIVFWVRPNDVAAQNEPVSDGEGAI